MVNKMSINVFALVLIIAGSAFGISSPADFDNSSKVGTEDLIAFAEKWLSEDVISENIDGIGRVDFADFSIFSSWWQWQASSNLLNNGDFEIPVGGGTLTEGGWTELGGSQSIHQAGWSSEESSQGVWLKGWNNNVNSGFYQDIVVAPDQKYIFDAGFRIETNFTHSGNINMEMIWHDGGDFEISRNVLDIDTLVANDGKWYHQSIVSTSPSNAVKVRVQISWTTGDQSAATNPRSAMVDNISLIGEANIPPVANNDGYTVEQDTQLTIDAPGVLINDTNPGEGTLSAILVTDVVHGDLSLNPDGSFTYDPDTGYSGEDHFTYRASNGTQSENDARVDITVLSTNPNVNTSVWPYAGSTADCTAAACYSGLYAISDRTTDTVEIRDIRHDLLYTVTSAQIQAEMGSSDISGNTYGPCALAFSASGRQLFISVCGQSNDAVLAFNTGTGILRMFKDALTLASSADNSALGLAHHKGELFVGTSGGDILRYRAEMNDMSGVLQDTVSFSGDDLGAEVVGITTDTYDQKLYIASPTRLYRLEPTVSPSVLTEIASLTNISDIGYGRTYGGVSQGGLYVLQNNGDYRSLHFISTASLRTGGPVTSIAYHHTTDSVNDIAMTACGRILSAGMPPTMISDSTDMRMDFETWLQDEFDQYVLFAKTLCWPDGEPEGWVINSNKAAGLNRSHPASPDAANWVVLMLLMADEVNNDSEAQGMVRAILKRYAGVYPDGIAPVVTPDGHFYHWYNPDTGNLAWGATTTSIYSTMKPVCMAIRAKAYYPDDSEIAEAANKIIYGIDNSRDFVRDFGASAVAADDLGPTATTGIARPYQETCMWSEQAAASDPMCVGSYLDYWRYRANHPYDNTLSGESIIRANASGFWEMYDASVLKFYREDSEWQQEFKNFYALFAAWTDDNAPHYLTAFSAGVNPDGYSADKFTNHPWTITSFGTVLGFGLNGNTVPVAGGYFAYRDGARQQMQASAAYTGANTLTRYSNEDPSWIMNSLSPTDHQYGGYALGELLSPGSVGRAIALDTYLPQTEQGVAHAGQVRLDFTKMLRHRVLGSNDGVNWISYGFQECPFTFDPGVSYSQYKTVLPEGEFVEIQNADFEDDLLGWIQSGDSQFGTVADVSDHIVGKSAEIRTHSGMVSSEGRLTQTINVSDDFETTQYIVRGDGFIATSGAPGNGYLRIQWDTDANADNGILGSEEESNVMDSTSRRVEFRINTAKPSGANYLHLSCVVQLGAPTLHRYIFDNLSVVRTGADISFANSGFEEGTFNGWTKSWPSQTSSLTITSNPTWVQEGGYAALCQLEPSMNNGNAIVLRRDYDISADPVGTRYIAQVKTKTGNLQGSFAYLQIYLDDDMISPYLRNESGDTLELSDTTSSIYQSISKRDSSENMLRLFIRVKRNNSSAVTTDEFVAFDDIQLLKVSR